MRVKLGRYYLRLLQWSHQNLHSPWLARLFFFPEKKSRSTTTFEAENENRRRSSFGTLEAGLFLDHTPHYDRRAAEQR